MIVIYNIQGNFNRIKKKLNAGLICSKIIIFYFGINIYELF